MNTKMNTVENENIKKKIAIKWVSFYYFLIFV